MCFKEEHGEINSASHEIELYRDKLKDYCNCRPSDPENLTDPKL